jgi:FkbM family methyltransferase
MKFQHGWAFPSADRFMLEEISKQGEYQRTHLDAALKFVTDFSVAIDGGAHIGTFSKVMSSRFARVIAAEPSTDTFEALSWNLREFGCANVEARNVALGEGPGSVEMRLDPEQTLKANTGARFVVEGGTIRVEAIDSWNLKTLGLLKLDVEGSEPMALRGAKQTIRRCRPIILYENKFLWARHYDLPKRAVADVLEPLGYREVARVSRDSIWSPK